jgi:hypothetical protein
MHSMNPKFSYTHPLVAALPQRLDPLKNRWVGVFEEYFERVGREVGEVIDGELFQGINQSNRLAGGFGGEGVGFVFVFTREDVAEQSEDHADRRVEEAEEDESSVERRAFDAERGVESLFGDEEREDEEHEQGRGQRDDDSFFDVALFAVSDFVRQHGDEFAGGVFFDQRVEEGDPFGFSKPCKVGVGFGGAL